MAASAVFILDLKGKVIISRNYRGDIPMSAASHFITRLLKSEEDAQLTPVLHEEGVTYVYVKHSNVYLLAMTERNINVALILLFLYKLIEVFQEYFTELEEESIRDNFVIVYELLDEMMDFGYPQTTDPSILQNYITQEGHKLQKETSAILKTVTGAVSWRPDNIRYRKNEVYLDVVEKVNLLVSSGGTILNSEIQGNLHMKTQLSGMPELRLGLNDRVVFEKTQNKSLSKGTKAIEMEDVNFHQCVRLSRFETNHTISFIPPDGSFDLMSYRLNTQVQPLIWIESIVESYAESRVEYLIKARSQFAHRSNATDVQIEVPVPKDSHSPKFKTMVGHCNYCPEQDSFVWNIKQFPGRRTFVLRAHFGLTTLHDEDEEEKPDLRPIKVKFNVPYFTVSGIQVRYLKIVEKSGYVAMPYVRYITRSGEYCIKIQERKRTTKQHNKLSNIEEGNYRS